MVYTQASPEIKRKLENASQQSCKKCLKVLSQTIEEKLSENKYAKIGGHEEFKYDMEQLEKQYRNENNLGVKVNSISIFNKE